MLKDVCGGLLLYHFNERATEFLLDENSGEITRWLALSGRFRAPVFSNHGSFFNFFR